MKLSDRKKKILQLVIDDYIATAQPVSSKSITEKYLTNISSATVRSELAGLEEMGYLTQLHTSSGRVPSIDAYKLYVGELMDKSKLSGKEIVAIKNAFRDHVDNLENVITSAVKVISELTDYTSVAIPSRSGKEKIVKLDIFRCKPGQALLLIATENYLIRDKFIEVPVEMTDNQVSEASRLIGKLLTGKQLEQISEISNTITEEFAVYREIFEGIMSAIEEYVEKDKPSLLVEGENKILNHAEYNDSEKVKNFLSVVAGKDKLRDLLASDKDNIEINIKIGGENGEIPEDCSMVTATYSASGVEMGTYGVIGPLRMDYQKVVSVLEGVGKVLEDMIKNKE
jgi:heat-inducible transcriptional repressor